MYNMIIRKAAAVMACLIVALLAAPAQAQQQKTSMVAMITDLVGEATLVDGKRMASILDEVNVDQRIKLEAGARMVLVYIKTMRAPA